VGKQTAWAIVLAVLSTLVLIVGLAILLAQLQDRLRVRAPLPAGPRAMQQANGWQAHSGRGPPPCCVSPRQRWVESVRQRRQFDSRLARQMEEGYRENSDDSLLLYEHDASEAASISSLGAGQPT